VIRIFLWLAHQTVQSLIALLQIGFEIVATRAVDALSKPCSPRLIGQKAQICAKNSATRRDSEQMISKTNWLSVDSERISLHPLRISADSERTSFDPERMLSETTWFLVENVFLRAEKNFSTSR